MTFSLVAVFIPVLFLGGIVGRLLHEFSVTIVVAILISGFVSLSLTPMLGSRFLKADHGSRSARVAVSHAGRRLQRAGALVRATLRHCHALSSGDLRVALLMLVGTVYLFRTMPTGFIPSQDSGFMFAVTLRPQDISFDSMAAQQGRGRSSSRRDPEV